MRRWRSALAIGLVLAGPAGAEEPKQSRSLHLMAGLPTDGDVWITQNTIGLGVAGGSAITINTITGEVTIPKGMSPSEASRRFWNAVAVMKGAPPPWPGSMPRP